MERPVMKLQQFGSPPARRGARIPACRVAILGDMSLPPKLPSPNLRRTSPPAAASINKNVRKPDETDTFMTSLRPTSPRKVIENKDTIRMTLLPNP